MVWAPALIRVLLALAVADLQFAADGKILHVEAFALLAWAFATIGWLLVAQPLQKSHILAQFGLDVGAAALAAWVAPTSLVHALALLAASAQLLFRTGFSTYYLSTLLIPLAIAPLRAKFAEAEMGSLASSASGNLIEQTIFTLTILATGISLAVSSSRADQLRQFAEEAVAEAMVDCDSHPPGQMDPDQPQLCKAHCDPGDQSPNSGAGGLLTAGAAALPVLLWVLPPADGPAGLETPASVPAQGPPRGAPPLYLSLLVLRN